MKDLWHALLGGLIALSVLCGIGSSAQAQSHSRLIYYGGPVLKQFTIYPLYYGDWSSPLDQAVMQAQYAYLKGLAAYLSGQGAPTGQRPTTWQYQVTKVSVGSQVTASPNVKGPTQVCDPPATKVQCKPSSETKIRDIIRTNQEKKTNPLHAYDVNTLIMVFLPTGFKITKKPGGCSYHGSESSSSIYAVVQTYNCGPLLAVTAHELFEAALDPVGGKSKGWTGPPEAVDQCSTSFNRPDIDKSVDAIVADFTAANPGQTFTWNTSLKAAVPGIADDTQPDPTKTGNVLCSTTGYIPIPGVVGGGAGGGGGGGGGGLPPPGGECGGPNQLPCGGPRLPGQTVRPNQMK
jgi:hypothetical protein